jgi:hypothetical protein
LEDLHRKYTEEPARAAAKAFRGRKLPEIDD